MRTDDITANMEQKSNVVYANGVFVKEIQTKSGDSFLNIDFKSEEFLKFMRENTNEKGYLKISVKRSRTPNKYGNTHYAVLNTFVPKPNPQYAGQRDETDNYIQREPIHHGGQVDYAF